MSDQVRGLSRVSLIFAFVFLYRPPSISLISSNSCGTALFSDGTYSTYLHLSCALRSFIARLLQHCHWNGYVLLSCIAYALSMSCHSQHAWGTCLLSIFFWSLTSFTVLKTIYGSEALTAHNYSSTLNSVSFAGSVFSVSRSCSSFNVAARPDCRYADLWLDIRQAGPQIWHGRFVSETRVLPSSDAR